MVTIIIVNIIIVNIIIVIFPPEIHVVSQD